MTAPTRAAWIAVALVVTAAAVLAWSARVVDPGAQLADFVSTTVVVGGPPAIAAWLIVRRTAAAMVGPGAFVGIVAVAMPEGARAGVFMLDGDASVMTLTRGEGPRRTGVDADLRIPHLAGVAPDRPP